MKGKIMRKVVPFLFAGVLLSLLLIGGCAKSEVKIPDYSSWNVLYTQYIEGNYGLRITLLDNPGTPYWDIDGILYQEADGPQQIYGREALEWIGAKTLYFVKDRQWDGKKFGEEKWHQVTSLNIPQLAFILTGGRFSIQYNIGYTP